ncbi:MAG: hypothetical protein JL50_12640 [Peptococcaceae bacterium BICA1-7]|nr:MAG: hypothetical protein JL50_12640 [Peptococcaceae bacterium BICA1-7]HBV97079.1 prepilin-type cleavage/methylation domain-containing protein [Desulfotomaculum sp.]
MSLFGNEFVKRLKAGLSQNKGFTLVELLVSMAVLAILVVAFVNFFGWSITSIFESGQKTKDAVAKADTKLQQLYYSMDDYESDSEYVSPGSVLTYKGRELNFCVEEATYLDVAGYKVTVVVFYDNGERYVSMTDFIKGGT